ncbi:hypothetical protein [Cohnella nanjingensis]|uniref:Uncharacterized protein n=1 Tax=Cohnella nanjingensis TaxID=1387779 RepID=A0A7X0VDS8_9BACL|nr:hypothetical protein [Cohnella nanjingensis]MBB6670282.1 hypothetical protein [Cohnella nanjingensis]
MKRSLVFIMLVAFSVVLFGCSSSKNEKSDVTLDRVIQAYVDQGITVDSNEKPMFQLIGAKDGVIFDIDGQKVAIYEYDSAKSLKKARADAKIIKDDWPVNGKFLLESSNSKAKEIFNGVK